MKHWDHIPKTSLPECFRITCVVFISILIQFSESSAARSVNALTKEEITLDNEAEYQELEDKISRHKSNVWRVNTFEAYDQQALIRESDRNPLDVLLRRSDALLRNLRKRQRNTDFTQIEEKLSEIKKQSSLFSNDKARIKVLFLDACKTRRELVFSDNRYRDINRILFVVHGVCGGATVGKKSEVAGEHMCDQYYGHSGRAGGIYILKDPFSSNNSQLVDIMQGKKVQSGPLTGQSLQGGSFLSPDLSFDGKTVIFAWSPGGMVKWVEKNRYKIFKCDTNGDNLAQLTSGNNDDFDPCWLPGGRIAFMSTRRGGYGRCHGRPVPTYALYSMKDDGSDIIWLSKHETNEWHPSVDNDGKIIYSRWDYVDRDDCIAHHIWHCWPDGRDARAWHGNYPLNYSTTDGNKGPDGRKYRPCAELNIRAIPPPAQKQYVATAAPHHGEAFGQLIIIDISDRDDGKMSQIKRLTSDPFPESEGGPRDYGTPWPIDEDNFLINHKRGIYTYDRSGNKELLYECDDIKYGVGYLRAIDPIPVQERYKPMAIPVKTNQGENAANAQLAVVSVMSLREADFTWPQGGSEIKWLRIIQIIPKSTIKKDKPRTGYYDESLCRIPLGVVPVESDGSAYFVAPVNRALYLQALDKDGLASMSMRSLFYVHPGEHLTCIGCHEDKYKVPSVPPNPLALQRSPSRIKEEVSDNDGAIPFNFYRLAKPVFDKKCVSCHSSSSQAPDMSYGSLKEYAFGFPGSINNITLPFVGGSRTTVNEFGAKASKLLKHLYPSHKNVNLTDDEFRRVTLWLDCNANEYGVYTKVKQKEQKQGKVVWPELDVNPKFPYGYQDSAGQVFATPEIKSYTGSKATFRMLNNLVFFSLPGDEQYTIEFVNVRGMTLKKLKVSGPESIAVSLPFAPGIYLTRVTEGTTSTQRKIYVQ